MLEFVHFLWCTENANFAETVNTHMVVNTTRHVNTHTWWSTLQDMSTHTHGCQHYKTCQHTHMVVNTTRYVNTHTWLSTLQDMSTHTHGCPHYKTCQHTHMVVNTTRYVSRTTSLVCWCTHTHMLKTIPASLSWLAKCIDKKIRPKIFYFQLLSNGTKCISFLIIGYQCLIIDWTDDSNQ